MLTAVKIKLPPIIQYCPTKIKLVSHLQTAQTMSYTRFTFSVHPNQKVFHCTLLLMFIDIHVFNFCSIKLSPWGKITAPEFYKNVNRYLC